MQHALYFKWCMQTNKQTNKKSRISKRGLFLVRCFPEALVWAERTVAGLGLVWQLGCTVCALRWQMHQMQTARNAAGLQKEGWSTPGDLWANQIRCHCLGNTLANVDSGCAASLICPFHRHNKPYHGHLDYRMCSDPPFENQSYHKDAEC